MCCGKDENIVSLFHYINNAINLSQNYFKILMEIKDHSPLVVLLRHLLQEILIGPSRPAPQETATHSTEQASSSVPMSKLTAFSNVQVLCTSEREGLDFN
jgi:hypothetical protein